MVPALAFDLLLVTSSIVLPGGPPVGMDYLAYDAANHRVWVPAGNTGNVDMIDAATGKVTPISGFKTIPNPRPGRPNMGPSSATIGDGAVWVGNRGDNKLCSLDARTLVKGQCVQLDAMPDGLVFVRRTRELWATTPRQQAVTIVRLAGERTAHSTIKLEGEPEGYAVDEQRGVFYTNLEDKNRTLAIDLASHKVIATWSTGCDEGGPRGLAIDPGRRLLFVACTDGATTLDLNHDGKLVGTLKTGGGVDNLDYRADKMLLYVAAGKNATLTVAQVAATGALSVAATVPTSPGARNPVLDKNGTAYLADSQGGRLIVVKPKFP